MTLTNHDVLWPLQVALFDTLKGDSSLSSKLSGVFDHGFVPEKTPFPYVTVGDAISTPQGAHDRFGARTVVTLHVWSDYDGQSEASSINGDLLRLLDHKQIPVSGHTLVAFRHEQSAFVPDGDSDLRHLVCRFVAITEAQP